MAPAGWHFIQKCNTPPRGQTPVRRTGTRQAETPNPATQRRSVERTSETRHPGRVTKNRHGTGSEVADNPRASRGTAEPRRKRRRPTHQIGRPQYTGLHRTQPPRHQRRSDARSSSTTSTCSTTANAGSKTSGTNDYQATASAGQTLHHDQTPAPEPPPPHPTAPAAPPADINGTTKKKAPGGTQ